ncbi:MAG: hypothetical protein IJ447_02115 [Clostridia bacterium]|nr:hypothetical protein [Clostridia bacterium]
MAGISAAKPMFAPMLEKSKITDPSYGAAQAVGKMISVEVKPQYKSGTLYADDGVAEEKKVFNYADVILNTSTLPLACAAVMFGKSNTNPETGDDIYDNVNDEAQYGAFGYIYGQVVDKKTSYVVVFLPKVMFDVPEEKSETQGENITFQTPTINGKAYFSDAGDWRIKTPCTTMAEAIIALESKFTSYNTASTEDTESGEVIEDSTDPETGDETTT